MSGPRRHLRTRAPAKVNLFLHVLGRRDNGYHDLDSLVAFVDVGDVLELKPAEQPDLKIVGPFAAALDEDLSTNLVLHAAGKLAAALPTDGKRRTLAGVSFHLTKNLPIASGIGGGSADAAAAIRMLLEHWDMDVASDDVNQLALALGADVPMCLRSEASWISGIGETIEPLGSFPDAWMVLANPGVEVSTPDIFKSLNLVPGQTVRERIKRPPHFSDFDAVCAFLRDCENDLQPAASERHPDISTLLSAIALDSACGVARMSGSGATCFGLYDNKQACSDAVKQLKSQNDQWWVAGGRILTSPPAVEQV